ncbi:MAG: hypothetical protein EXS03_00245 [Phycisphaerales bacterium]|nr:hypothetical protein [Phycisphaerales bacterium]
MFDAWSFDPWLLGGVAAIAFIYARGARRFVGRVSGFPWWRPWCFGAGIVVLVVALASPLDALGHLLLYVHMAQHWLLIMVVAPLILLGAPGIPVLRGLPEVIRRDALGPFLASRKVRRVFAGLVHPVTGWTAMALATWLWHWPPLYGAALESPAIHRLEHASFLVGAMLFWWPVISPWPWRRRWPRIALVGYLLAADVQNTIFCAILTFSGSVLYPSYAATSPAMGWDALRDQHVAGALMWTAGQVVVLPTAMWLVIGALKGERRSARRERGVYAGFRVRVPRARRHFDLLRVLLIGRALRNRTVRGSIRWILVACAAIVVVDGCLGPVDAPSNIAGTIPWTHWRGVIVVALLLGGNFLCMSCPLMAPRNLLRRWITPRWQWPQKLRNKWLVAGLVVVWLVTYEAFDLWSSPLATAWIIIGYFVAAALVDSIFRGASFCKWVCPIGQLHMSMSLVSPLSVSVKQPGVCASCTTHECIKGVELRVNGSVPSPGRMAIPGCELDLYQPAKRGNMDCTFCLDCVDACPHGNVGIVTQKLRRGLASRQWGSSIGRIVSRTDASTLLAILTFGAFANALGMTAPWLGLADSIAADGHSLWFVETVLSLLAIIVAPAALMLAASIASMRVGGAVMREAFCTGAHGLVPLGAAMWASHWIFHLSSGWATALPAVQRAAGDLGVLWLGEPDWAASCCGPLPPWLQPIELMVLQAGLLVSCWMLWRSALGSGRAGSIRRVVPWWILATGLFALGTWIVLQPMQMRGTAMP